MLVGDVRCATTGRDPPGSCRAAGRCPRAHERLEEAPGAAASEPQRSERRRPDSSRVGRLAGRQADPAGDQRREQPEDDERRRDRRRPRLQDEDERPPTRPRWRARRPSAGRSPARSRSRRALAWAAVIHSSRSRWVTVDARRASGRWRRAISHGLVGEEHDAERDVAGRERRRRRPRPEGGCASRCPAAAAAALRGPAGRRHDDRGQDEAGPQRGRRRGQRPGDEQGRQRERRRQRPAQVVEHLPAPMAGIGTRLRPSRRALRPRIQGRSCQSPRAQRCWRAAATS